MAYFACSKAAKTGTDSATRKSIAKGTVSPTFKSTTTGKETLRGVVQLDVINNRDMSYVTSTSLTDRLASALGINKSSKSASSKGGGSVSVGQTSQTQLYESNNGIIKTSTNLGLNKKTVLGVVGVIIGILILLNTKRIWGGKMLRSV